MRYHRQISPHTQWYFRAGRHRGVVAIVDQVTRLNVRYVNLTCRRNLKGPFWMSIEEFLCCAEPY